MKKRAAVMWCVLLALAAPTFAELRLPAVFGDHMVLQRGGELPVWGWADAGDEVSVTIAGHRATVATGDDGKWRVDLPAMEAGGPFEMTVKAGGETVTFTDVLVGEVWLCSGQSNMEWSLWNTDGGQEAINAPQPQELRIFQVERVLSDTPLDDVTAKWSRCDAENLGGFSGVAYFMGLKLQSELGVPVGLIHSSFGGSAAEAWMPEDALRADTAFAPLLIKLKDYRQQMENWASAKKAAESSGAQAPAQPANPFGWRGSEQPGALYNAMLHPLIPYRIRGAVWYQGETNTGRAQQYRRLLPAMIAQWRGAWGQGDFPFGIVQLPQYTDPKSDTLSTWPELREAQLLTALEGENIGLVVTIDVGDAADLHPRNKRPVGERLALWALGDVYGMDVVSSGPVFRQMQVVSGKAYLEFDHAGSGLTTRDGGPPRGFAVAAADGNWNWAQARIDGDTVVVWVNGMTNPAAVRYAWAGDPQWANLMNKEGLPASPFRTDGRSADTAGGR